MHLLPRHTLACLLVFAAALTHAQEPPPESPSDVQAEFEPAAQRAQLDEDILEFERRLEDLAQDDPAAVLLRSDLAILESIEAVYLRWMDQIDRGANLARQKREIEDKIASGYEAVIGHPPPYGLARIDELATAWEVAPFREKDLRSMLQAAHEARDGAKLELAERERARRELRERTPDLDQRVEAEQTARLLERAALEIRLAQTRVDLARVKAENAEAELALQQLLAGIGDETLEWARARVRFDPEELARAMSAFDNREAAARERLDRAKVELEAAEARLDTAQSRLDVKDTERDAQLEARRLARLVAQQSVAQSNEELERIAKLRAFTEGRHRALETKIARSELMAWKDDARDFIDEVDRARRLAEGRVVELSGRHAETLEKLGPAGERPPGIWIRRQADELQRFVNLVESELEALAASRAIAARAHDDFARHGQSISPGDIVDSLRTRIDAGWDTELVVVDDRSVTTGRIVTAMILFVLGFIASRIASRLLGRVLARGLSVDSGAVVAFQGLSFYLLLVLFFLLALRTVEIPLTAFTVLGGGIAIGVGFGSQNVINNFISGLILMVERPIKVGDIVDVDATYGEIEHIGARSTRVRTADNIHIIVPNSSFLQKNVINWTLSDNLIRTYVDVGVAYGSATRDVDRLIRRALDDHGKVLDEPAPEVLFTEFGDNALIFRAVFWLQIRVMMDRRKIESDVRHRIDRLFRDAGITIAFPQRDVHLDSVNPIEVRVTSAQESPTNPKG